MHHDHHEQLAHQNLRLSMFHPQPGKFPALKGKAAETRHLAPVLASVFQSLMNVSDKQHRQVKLGLCAMARIEAILDDHADDYRLPASAAGEVEQCLCTLIQAQTALANHYHPKGQALFHFTVKSHYALHLGSLAHFVNPRMGWCYGGEDMMSRVQGLAQASLRGTRPYMVSATMMRKYAFALGLGMARRHR